METKDKINDFLTKIKDLEESIKEKTNELNETWVTTKITLQSFLKSSKISQI